MEDEFMRVLAFVGLGLCIGQIWVFFALRDFKKQFEDKD